MDTPSHPYFPHTAQDIAAMLERCGVKTVEELYRDVPDSVLFRGNYDLPAAMSEPELRRFFKQLSRKNSELICFAGAGFYQHYTPAVIPALLSRSEFYTAYTPYQPEISQGTLQYIFEYQSIMCALTGMEVCNASMYDGTTATAEAMMMAVNSVKRRRRVLLSATVNPLVAQVVNTYASYNDVTVEVIPETDGVTDRQALSQMLGAGDVAAVIVAAPNYFGIIEDYTGLADEVHAAKALLIMNCHATTLSVLRTPAEWGADIACGEAQSLGLPLNYGGPYLGYLCCRRQLMRKMPGRIVGATTDDRGQRVFVLTLQAREQHIRREKATSNICSNQGIMTLHAVMYASLMGAEGLRRVNGAGAEGMRRLAAALCETGKLRLKYPDKPFLNEALFEMADGYSAQTLIEMASDAGILAGVRVGFNGLLIAVTEQQNEEDMKAYVAVVNSLKKENA